MQSDALAIAHVVEVVEAFVDIAVHAVAIAVAAVPAR